ncbi:MAG: TetR family transcriptional regulator [Acetobacteraceae bacterium]|nr:TetR family transcriptional regulator [Acetobacteraceae bacterium]
MDDPTFDSALVTSALNLAAEQGWTQVSVCAAARAANLSLDRARSRFPARNKILLHLGRLADQAGLADPSPEGSSRDKLFDVLMRRIDIFQAHRDGVLALLRALPTEPATAASLACATQNSMGLMLGAAGIATTGLRGALRVRGITLVWLWTLRAWQTDTSADLSATMAALDTALTHAEPLANWLNGVAPRPASTDTTPETAPAP